MVCCYCSPQEGGGVNPNSPAISTNTSKNPFVSLNIEHIEVSNEGIHIKLPLLESFNMDVGSKVRCLLQKGYLVITNLPHKIKTLDAIEELQYRQDETKRDFTLPIAQLAQQV